MSAILFEPHADDGVLFASYTIMRDEPFVVTVLGADEDRFRETEAAVDILAPSRVQAMSLGFTETPDWDEVGYRLERLDATRVDVEKVWAPLPELGGHQHHTEVGQLAKEIFGDRCHFYATYKRGHGRTVTDNEVIPEDFWPAVKFQAMACYVSQIIDPAMRPWWSNWDREWIA